MWRSGRPRRSGAGLLLGLLLFCFLQTVRAQDTDPPPVCLDGLTPEVLAAALLPVEVRVGDQLVGVLIVKLVGQQVLVRAEDLEQDGAGLALPHICTAGQYLALPARLKPQLDTEALELRLAPGALAAAPIPPDVPTPDSPQATGTLLNVGASVLAVGGQGSGNQVSDGQVTGLLSADADSRLSVQPGAAGGDVQTLGLRGSGSFGVHLVNGQAADTAANLAGAYLYRQTGELETDLGLIPASVQSDLGAQQGSPLLGVSLRRVSAAGPDAPLRIDSPEGGRYRVLFRGVVLRQGDLQPGVTLIQDFVYPPVQDVLSIEIRDAAGTLLGSYAVPFDRRPQSRPVGTLDTAIEAGLRDDRPSAGLSGSLTVTPDTALQAALLLGSDRGIRAGLRLNAAALALSADASTLTTPTTQPGQGDTRHRQISLGLSRAQPWGSWTLRGSAEEVSITTGAGAEVGRSTLLGLQAAVFLTRPALQIQGKVEQFDSVMSDPAAQTSTAQASTAQASTLRGELSLAGSFRLGRPPETMPDPFDANTSNADWTVRLYASQTSVPGSAAAPLRQGGVSATLNLRMLDDRPDLVVQGGVQDGLPLLAVQRTVQQEHRQQEGGQQGSGQQAWNLISTVRVLPTPALSLIASGPYTASLGLVSGAAPVLSATFASTLALTGGQVRPLPSATRQAVLVQVGVPGVQVSSQGVVATTDASGQATLPLASVLRRSEVEVLLDSLPLSTSFSVLTLTVQPATGALLTVADFRPYLTRTNLRQLPASVPLGAVARLGEQRFTVQQSRYIQLDARNGDRVAVTWPTGSCTALWSDQEVLSCQTP